MVILWQQSYAVSIRIYRGTIAAIIIMKKIYIMVFILIIAFPAIIHSATLEISNTVISPGSNVNSSINIKVTLTNESNVDIKIYELTGSKKILVRNLMNKNMPTKSSFQVEWDGRNDNGEIVDNGKHEVEMVLSDVAKPFRKAILKKTIQVENYYAIEELKFFPSPFSPSRETATIFYQLSRDANVSLKIVDSSGNPVVRLIDNKAVLSGKNSLSWDGRSKSGVVLSSGVYSANLEISVSGKKEERRFPFRIVEGIEIKNLTAMPEKINPEGINSYITVSFTMDKRSDYSLRVYNSAGKEVWYSGINEGIPGENSIVWGGLKKVKFKTNVYYNIKVAKKDIADKNAGNKIETVKYKKTINEEMDGKDLKYTLQGNPVVYSMAKAGESIVSLDEIGSEVEVADGNIIYVDTDRVEIIFVSIKPESLPSGEYSIEVSARDPVTKEISASRAISVLIDLERPFRIIVNEEQIRGVNKKADFFPKDISATGDKKYADIVIPFELTKDANVKINILSRKGGIEKEIDMGRVLGGISEARWNGMNQYNRLVPPGDYRIKILATETLLSKKPKTIEYYYDVHIKNIPKVVAGVFKGTNIFYAFDTGKDYLFSKPVISSEDIFNNLVGSLNKNKADKEGVVTIDFEFSEPVTINCVVLGEDESNGKRAIIQKKEWLDIAYTDENNYYRWSWDGKKSTGKEDNPLLYKYGIEYEESEIYIQPGLYQVWIFAVSKDSGRDSELKEITAELANKKWMNNEELQAFLEKNIADKDMVFEKKEIKGMGVLTEIGLHIEGVINKGIGEFINYLTRGAQ